MYGALNAKAAMGLSPAGPRAIFNPSHITARVRSVCAGALADPECARRTTRRYGKDFSAVQAGTLRVHDHSRDAIPEQPNAG